MGKILSNGELPKWFKYPSQFMRIYDLGLLNLEPWIILEGEQLRVRYKGLRARYKGRELVPFARREDNDDVACWEKDCGEQVVIIHDFASPGYEHREKHKDFWTWFRLAVEDMIEFE